MKLRYFCSENLGKKKNLCPLSTKTAAQLPAEQKCKRSITNLAAHAMSGFGKMQIGKTGTKYGLQRPNAAKKPVVASIFGDADEEVCLCCTPGQSKKQACIRNIIAYFPARKDAYTANAPIMSSPTKKNTNRHKHHQVDRIIA